MNYYWFNRQKACKKQQKKMYSKEKAVEYYSQNKEPTKEK